MISHWTFTCQSRSWADNTHTHTNAHKQPHTVHYTHSCMRWWPKKVRHRAFEVSVQICCCLTKPNQFFLESLTIFLMLASRNNKNVDRWTDDQKKNIMAPAMVGFAAKNIKVSGVLRFCLAKRRWKWVSNIVDHDLYHCCYMLLQVIRWRRQNQPSSKCSSIQADKNQTIPSINNRERLRLSPVCCLVVDR